MLESFTIETFSGHLGESFRLYPDAASPLEVELVSATGPDESTGDARPFSIVFRGPADTLLPQRIYQMEHAGIGSFELFLVPIAPDEEGHRYEAVFN